METAHQPALRRSSARWWLVRLAAAVALGLALGVVVDVVRLGGPERWLVAHRLPPPYVPGGVTVEVGGAGFYLDCRGAGSPTVLLESGLGTGAAGWGFVPDQVAAVTRVCAWDRPGIGASEGIGRHTMVEAVRHVRAGLAAAGEAPPFVVVGHSLGGVYARVFAATLRDEVVGVVLVDPYLPDIHPGHHVAIDPALRAEGDAGIAATNGQVAAIENLDWTAVERELAASSVDGLPLELLFVEQRLRWDERFDRWEDELIATWRRLVLALSADSRLTIAENSTHMIQWDRPELVVEAIRRLVDRARD